MFEQYWEKHPVQHELVEIVREGEWVTHVFEWIFMMVSRFAGYVMTFAVGYLIFYAIEMKRSLDVMPLHPQLADNLATYSNVIINVAPELVFPGVVVLCIRAFTVRRWLDGAAYVVTTIVFVTLTMALLNAFMNNQITKEFLASMLFWRAGAALFYTVVVAYCGGHGGLDFKTLLRELDGLRGQLDGGQQTVSSLQEQLSTVQQQASTVRQQLTTEQQEVSRLRRQLDIEEKRANKLQSELETGEGDTGRLRRELNAALIDADGLRTQLEGKAREVAGLRGQLQSGEQWQGSRVSSLQQQLTDEQEAAVPLRRQLNAVQLEIEGLRTQLDGKQQDVERVQGLLNSEQRTVSNLRQAIDTEKQMVSTLRQQLDSVQVSSVQLSSGQTRKADNGQTRKVDNGQSKAESGQGKVLTLDTSRPRKSGQGDAAENALGEQIRVLMAAEPGISGRKIAERLGCSPTTAAKHKSLIEGVSADCVNE
jgi:predicted  nucleic acid-binding Zn-ribbon protein